MNKGFFLTLISMCPFFLKSQTLGGYSLVANLATAVHPNGCSSSYVTNYPNDSIWANLLANDIMTGVFSAPSIDSVGSDLLLETGFHGSNYFVSLLLTNGKYSTIHMVNEADWNELQNTTWYFVTPLSSCATGYLSFSNHYILPLDFNLDFGLTQSDTIIGIKIVFLASPGASDFAGAYILNHQQVGINEHLDNSKIEIYPNPFNDKLNISLNSPELYEIILYDITSIKKFDQLFIHSTSINTEQLAKGIYLYEVRNNSGVIKQGKVVKE